MCCSRTPFFQKQILWPSNKYNFWLKNPIFSCKWLALMKKQGNSTSVQLINMRSFLGTWQRERERVKRRGTILIVANLNRSREAITKEEKSHSLSGSDISFIGQNLQSAEIVLTFVGRSELRKEFSIIPRFFKLMLINFHLFSTLVVLRAVVLLVIPTIWPEPSQQTQYCLSKALFTVLFVQLQLCFFLFNHTVLSMSQAFNMCRNKYKNYQVQSLHICQQSYDLGHLSCIFVLAIKLLFFKVKTSVKKINT